MQSQAVKASPFIFTSAALPIDKDGNLYLHEPIGQQTERCIHNLQAVLEAAGSGIGQVVKTTVFIIDMKDFAEVNGVYENYFTHRPARSCIAVKQLAKECPVEIECIALTA